MCRIIKLGKAEGDPIPDNINVEFQRDASLRATEVIITNHNHAGVEQQAVVLMCKDNGDITIRTGPIDLIEPGEKK